MRDGQWKLLCDYDGGRPELYNLITDPGETTNLADKHTEKTKQLTKQVLNWHQSMPAAK